MNLSEIKSALSQVDEVIFTQPDGKRVPAHFHVTEVGTVEKHFIDCGSERGQTAKCDKMTLQFLILRNIHLINENNVAKIANKRLLGDNFKL